ncbi:MAG: ABC transporter substrate-binding protein [Hansschlegelia sp.]
MVAALASSAALWRRPAFASAPAGGIVAVDWAAAESLLALGVAPRAVADVSVYREWLPEIALPPEVLDLGSRADPNFELVASLRPDRILISNWQANLKEQFERIAPTETIAIIAPPSSPLRNAAQALLQVARPLGRSGEAERYLAAFEDALGGLAARRSSGRAVIVAILHENGRQLYAYGEGSWVHDVLVRLGIRNALKARTSRFGNALINLAQLADYSEARLLYLDQGERTRRAEEALSRSTLWGRLPIVIRDDVRSIPAFYALGGLPSAWRCARLIANALNNESR